MPAKKKFFNTIFSAYDFLKLDLHHFSKMKIQKESQNSRNQGFSYYFCMMIEGSGSGSFYHRAKIVRKTLIPGSIPLTSGSRSGSWRPKNTWIRWIRIRLRIRIRNTARVIINSLCMHPRLSYRSASYIGWRAGTTTRRHSQLSSTSHGQRIGPRDRVIQIFCFWNSPSRGIVRFIKKVNYETLSYCRYQPEETFHATVEVEVNLNFKGLTFYYRHTCSLVSLGGQSYMYILNLIPVKLSRPKRMDRIEGSWRLKAT